MNKNEKILIIGVVVICIVIAFAAYNFGFIHNGSFAKEGAVYGPGTYVIGKDLPPGFYGLIGNISVVWDTPNMTYSFPNNITKFFGYAYGNQLDYSAENALKNGTIVTVRENASLRYDGPVSSHGENIINVPHTSVN